MKGKWLWILCAAASMMLPAITDAQRPTTTIEPRGRGVSQFAQGRFIVTLRDGVDPIAVSTEHGIRPDHIYRTVFTGFGAAVSDIARTRLQSDPRVVRIEQDAIVTAYQTTAQSWGLDRIDQRSLPLDNLYTRRYNGSGVTIYIVDTGIRYDHTEFGGRAIGGYDAFGGDGSDCQGHGTHVAGMAAGANYGVASGASLVSVRVLDCNGSGYTSGVIAGLDWIAANKRTPAVVNMSLGGPVVQALDDAVLRLISGGTLVVAAAGNDNTDACLSSPSRVAQALTVGASDNTDQRGGFSNWGACVDMFAPGVMVPGPYFRSSTDLVYMSGTSTASPHVAGAVALLLQHYPSLGARQAADSMRAYATKGVVVDSKSTNNHLLYSLEGAQGTTTPTPTVNMPPSSSFTVSCSDLACTFTDRSADADGSVVGWNWAFGTGATSTAHNPSYTYPAAGSYTVTLKVTDDKGAVGTSSGTFTVSAPATTPPPTTSTITIALSSSRSSKNLTTDIRWSGASGASVDLYRNGAKLSTTPNDGHFRDVVRVKGSGTITYRVCQAGSTTICSATASAAY